MWSYGGSKQKKSQFHTHWDKKINSQLKKTLTAEQSAVIINKKKQSAWREILEDMSDCADQVHGQMFVSAQSASTDVTIELVSGVSTDCLKKIGQLCSRVHWNVSRISLLQPHVILNRNKQERDEWMTLSISARFSPCLREIPFVYHSTLVIVILWWRHGLWLWTFLWLNETLHLCITLESQRGGGGGRWVYRTVTPESRFVSCLLLWFRHESTLLKVLERSWFWLNAKKSLASQVTADFLFCFATYVHRKHSVCVICPPKSICCCKLGEYKQNYWKRLNVCLSWDASAIHLIHRQRGQPAMLKITSHQCVMLDGNASSKQLCSFSEVLGVDGGDVARTEGHT